MTKHSDEWSDEMFSRAKKGKEALAEIFGEDNAEALVKRRVGRPVAENPKEKVTIRLDADLLESLRASGKGWQSRINDVLRDWAGM